MTRRSNRRRLHVIGATENGNALAALKLAPRTVLAMTVARSVSADQVADLFNVTVRPAIHPQLRQHNCIGRRP